MAMMDRAEQESGWSSVMSQIHTLKIYNPAPGDLADPEKAGKFKLKEAVTGDEKYLEWEIKFNVLSIAYSWTGGIYPTHPDGSISDEEVVFSSSEFGKYEKRIDPIGLSVKGKAYAFYTKGEFETMIKTPMLNGVPNQFYEKKKDKDNKPYHGTLLRRSAVIYGQFIWGEYDKEYFRMFTSPNNIGITYDAEAGAAIEPDEGTLEYVTIPALAQMNEIRSQNGRKALSRVSHDQCDVLLTIRTNDKGNFLPVFSFAGLTAMRGYDNGEDVKFIHDLKAEHFRSIFGQMGVVTPIMIDGTKASMPLPQMATTEHHEAIAAPKTAITEADIEATFDGPSKEDF
jgi:hypothetical protein